jgi:Fic family protein
MKRGPQGEYRIQQPSPEPFRAYIPYPLPPKPPIELDSRLQDLLEQANRALGRLDGIAMILPNVSFFLYTYVRKEAVVSSQIEGAQSSLSDLLLFESDAIAGAGFDDVVEVSNYVAALTYGLERIHEGAALTGRLLREIHEVLLRQGRGSEQQPGEFRRSQNWIGGSRPGNAAHVPPPHLDVPECMGELEKFLHDSHGRTPTLIKAALAHVQFETIHPFLDGNGRLGRLLIAILLCYEEVLREPLLYLSLYFKLNRQRYYELLQDVRQTGDWEAWLEFFLAGVRDMADQAASTASACLTLFEEDRRRIEASGRATSSVIRAHAHLQRRPITTLPAASRAIGVTHQTLTVAMQRLTGLGIVREVSGRQRNRVFVYDRYMGMLSEGTEPIKH